MQVDDATPLTNPPHPVDRSVNPSESTDDPALLHALLLDGRGGATKLDDRAIEAWQPGDGVLWMHVDITSVEAVERLSTIPGLDSRQAALLATTDTRPHADIISDTVRLALRGVNLHPDANPEDMVSLRIWAADGRVASARRRWLMSVEDIHEALIDGEGPRTTGELLVALAARLITRMGGTIDTLEARILDVEDALDGNPNATLQREIADIRRTTIALRRYLAPQRDALSQLGSARLLWLSGDERLALKDGIEILQRHIDDLDSVRERATVAREEFVNHQSGQTNRRMFMLSILSAVFLPLSFLTGLLGINLGGIPGADDPHAFGIATALLIAVGLAIVLFFRFGRWF